MPISFAEFASTAPAIAAVARERLAATGLVFVSTLRRDGSPRISPFEASVIEGRLFVGSMPGAVKARDLQRDGRCCLITTLAGKDDHSPEVKLWCRAVEITDPSELAARGGAALEGTEIAAEDLDGSHGFELLIEAAAEQHIDDETWRTTSWKEGQSVRFRRRVGAAGTVEDE